MAVLFLDSSALVKRYAQEVGSAWITARTDPAAGNQCWIAGITPVEIFAAIYKKVRTGNLSLAQAQAATALELHSQMQTQGGLPPLEFLCADAQLN
jgi:predicted nucleic acid-binding protein